MTPRLRSTIAQLGWLNAIVYAGDLALRHVTRQHWALYKYQFVAQPVGAAPLCHGRGRDIAVRLLADAAEIPAGYPRPTAVVAARYEQGAQSLAAFRGDELIGFLWWIFGAYQEDEVRARFSLACAQACWDFDVYVRPEDRLGWAFRRLWDEAQALLRARAVRWSCSRISAFNPASLRAHARLGTVALGSATFLCCGRWQWMIASLAPYIHLSRHPGAFPQLLIDTSALADDITPESPCPISTK